MIVLDTNVVSEALRVMPNRGVVSWLDEQHVETLFLTSLTLAELRYGVAALPEGRRKHGLDERLEGEMLPLFAGRVLDFDDAASRPYARLQAAARASGKPLGAFDALIAAVCVVRGFALATRNVRDFRSTGVALINPWDR